MKIALGNEPYIERDTGKPVEGRLTVYEIHTDIKATTYTIEGNNGFVEASNPVLLHGGMPDDSLFVELGLYGLKIERYIGPEGQMSVESPDAYFEQIDYLEAGMDFDPQASSANVLDTLDDLQGADPSLKFVTVLWHDTAGDCVPRQYFWDEGAQDSVDGGYVVGSDVSDSGRWILLWADEILPCSVYGVTPSNISNLNLLLNYPDTVGSLHLVTASCVRFTSGTYTPNFIYATDKELVFDGDAKFTNATFQCPRARVMGNQPSYIADFQFYAPDAEAHSSWFRTLQAFWHCGAKYLFLDSTNYFTTSLITSNVNLGGKVVMGSSRLPNTYANGVHFIIASDTSISGRIFNTSDFVRVSSDGYGDGIFARTGSWDPGLISAGHHVQYDTTPDLDLFESTERWVSTMVERRARLSSVVWSSYVLDLQNRRYAGNSLNVGLFRDIRNVYCKSISVNNSGNNLVFHNVQAEGGNVICNQLVIYDSDITFTNEPSISAMWCYDSRMNSLIQWRTPGVQCIFERCWVGIGFNRVTNNEHTEAMLSFTDCQFQQNVSITTKNLEMYRCKTDNNYFKIYPYKSGSNYYIKAVLVGNNFNSAYPIEFTKIDSINGQYQEDCYDCILQWNIVGNTFLGNTEGLRMRYWQNRTGSYWSRTFVKPGSGVHSITYEGNVGKCPAENMRGVSISDNKAYTTETYSTSTLYKYAGAWQRCLIIPGSLWWNGTVAKGPNTLVKWYNWVNSPYNSLTYDMFVQTTWFAYPKAHDDPLNNGDFFANAILIFGDYLRIVQRGDGDRNDGVVGRVI